MRIPSRVAVASGFVAFIALGATAGVAWAGSPETPTESRELASDLAAEEVLGVLAEPSPVAFPNAEAAATLSDGGFSSLAYLGSKDGTSYWTGEDSSALVCLVAYVNATKVGAASCDTPDSVEAEGLDLGFEQTPGQPDEDVLVAVLLPDSAQGAAAPSGGTSTVDLLATDHESSTSPWDPIGESVFIAQGDELEDGTIYEFDRQEGAGKAIEVTG